MIRIAREGFPFVLGFLALALVAAFLGWAAPALALGALGLCCACFFRDPDREVPTGPGLVVSPADGRVMVVAAVTDAPLPGGRGQKVSIFLSPLDVHINRSPIGGVVGHLRYVRGRFLPAFRPEASAENEQNEIRFDQPSVSVAMRQIVGVLARRIVCRVREGMHVERGERIGLMKFGSRVDLFLPVEATLRVKVGDHVRGGETVVGAL